MAINIGPLQFTLRALGRFLTAPAKYAVGTPSIERRLDRLEQHIAAMTNILHFLVASLSANWSDEQRERVQHEIANFTLVNQGSARLRPSGNPVSAADINRLREYVRRAEAGGTFSPEEAKDLRDLAETISMDSPRDEWVTELLKLALFIFGVYVHSEIFKPTKQD